MNNDKMGKFISDLRKSHQMTQKDLAEKLNVSDKAVSKWERGLSCPDISNLSPLSEILGITITELLNGEQNSSDIMNVEVSVVNALEYGVKSTIKKIKLTQNIWAATFSILLLLGIFVVSIVNVAISGTLTWSLIPISSCIFAWLVFFPTIKFGMKGVAGSLITLSLFIVPFLYTLDYVINRFTGYNEPIFPTGIRIAPFSIVYIWISLLLFKKLKTKKLLVCAILVMLAIPLNFFINFMLNQPWLGVQTVLNASISSIIAIKLIKIHVMRRKKI